MVGKVEGSKEKILTSRFNIVGYPTFYVIDGWDVYEFKGVRSRESLTNYVKKDYKKDEVRIDYSWKNMKIGLSMIFLRYL